MRVESDFFRDYKKESENRNFEQHFFCHSLNFELIAVSAFKSSVSAAAYPLLCRKSLFFNVNRGLK
jgi:hypothetical protein